MGGSHALIDAVAVPEFKNDEDEEEFDPLGGKPGDIFADLDIFFRKTLLDSGSEWEKSHHKKVIDTKEHRGNVSKAIPNKGKFSYVHVDINGEGGFAHIVEDEAKFGRTRALQALSEGPLGNTLTNLKVAFR